jgi:hypothetical protein
LKRGEKNILRASKKVLKELLLRGFTFISTVGHGGKRIAIVVAKQD